MAGVTGGAQTGLGGGSIAFVLLRPVLGALPPPPPPPAPPGGPGGQLPGTGPPINAGPETVRQQAARLKAVRDALERDKAARSEAAKRGWATRRGLSTGAPSHIPIVPLPGEPGFVGPVQQPPRPPPPPPPAGPLPHTPSAPPNSVPWAYQPRYSPFPRGPHPAPTAPGVTPSPASRVPSVVGPTPSASNPAAQVNRQFPSTQAQKGPFGGVGVLIQFGKAAVSNPVNALLLAPSALGVAANLRINVDAWFASHPEEQALAIINAYYARLAAQNHNILNAHDC